jgi:hypothetical protein
MDSKTEVQEWLASLNEESSDIKRHLDSLYRDISLPKSFKQKFSKVSDLLLSSIESFSQKCELSISSDLRPSTAAKLKQEYYRLMKSIDNFFNTCSIDNLKPHYIFTTFASRVRSATLNNIQRKQSLEVNEPEINDLKTAISLERKTERLKEKLVRHEHLNLAKQITRLEKETQDNRRVLGYLVEETSEHSKTVNELLERVKILEIQYNK